MADRAGTPVNITSVAAASLATGGPIDAARQHYALLPQWQAIGIAVALAGLGIYLVLRFVRKTLWRVVCLLLTFAGSTTVHDLLRTTSGHITQLFS
ncbi:hypothetical protein ABIB25_000936 [Nakamurella sp. UYEF19]|uniref:hypothetical protein n=1 Tax=Nakamurella sp. UYEF19 TaxID=1756392 RepID=UPI0033922180